MKKVWTVISLFLGILTTSAAIDGVVNLHAPAKFADGSNRMGTGNGGPYKVTIQTGSGVPYTSAMDAVADLGNPFLSFCLERNENIKLPGIGYNVEISSAAKLGGIAGATGGADPISLATAWLYRQFRSGLLDSFANPTRKLAKVYDDLQQAIWWLEQELETPAANNYLVSAAVSATGAGTAINARKINADGAYGVRVLNMTGGPGAVNGRNQDILAITAVPEPSTYVAGALLLIPILVQVRRKLSRP